MRGEFEEIPLPFTFPFCGFDYNSVFVGSNGYLTFGAGDTDFSESVTELLNEEPRIAALWDDLSPNNGGTIQAGVVASSATIEGAVRAKMDGDILGASKLTVKADGDNLADADALAAEVLERPYRPLYLFRRIWHIFSPWGKST